MWLNGWHEHCDVIDYPLSGQDLRDASAEITRQIAWNAAKRKQKKRNRSPKPYALSPQP